MESSSVSWSVQHPHTPPPSAHKHDWISWFYAVIFQISAQKRVVKKVKDANGKEEEQVIITDEKHHFTKAANSEDGRILTDKVMCDIFRITHNKTKKMADSIKELRALKDAGNLTLTVDIRDMIRHSPKYQVCYWFCKIAIFV